MGDLLQFVPRPNPRSDRAFWIGPDQIIAMDNTSYPDPLIDEYVASAGYDPGPAGFKFMAPDRDGA